MAPRERECDRAGPTRGCAFLHRPAGLARGANQSMKSDAGRYRYGAEKLYSVIRYSARAPGDARARLAGAYSELVLVRKEHLPPTAWALVTAVLKRLTRGDVSVKTNTRMMKNTTAARLLGDLWDAHEIVRRAYDRDMGHG